MRETSGLPTAFAALVLAAAPVGISAPTAAAQTTVDGPRLASILETLDQQPDAFGGYTIDRSSRTVTVRLADMQHWSPGDFLASLNPAMAADYADSPDLNGSWTLTFAPARASVGALAAITADLPTTEPFATAAAALTEVFAKIAHWTSRTRPTLRASTRLSPGSPRR